MPKLVEETLQGINVVEGHERNDHVADESTGNTDDLEIMAMPPPTTNEGEPLTSGRNRADEAPLISLASVSSVDIDALQALDLELATTNDPVPSSPGHPDEDGNGDGMQMPSTGIEGITGAVVKYCQLPFSIAMFVGVAGTTQFMGPRNKFFLNLCYICFLVAILVGTILLILTKQKFRGNVVALICFTAIAFALDVASLHFLCKSISAPP